MMNFEASAEMPTLQDILASLLWLTAHPHRQSCLHHQHVVMQQMRCLAGLSDPALEPALRSVAEQLSDEIENALNQQLSALRHRGIPALLSLN